MKKQGEFMRRYLLGICMGLTIISASNYAITEEKIYLDSSTIIIGNNGIFTKLNEEIVQLKSINHDQNGIYVDTSNVYPEILAWYCKTCEKHRIWDPCQYCNSPAPKHNDRE